MDPMIGASLIGLAGEGLGLGLQKKYQDMQVQGQKDLGKFNQELAMQMWKDTNYKAQTQEMKKAGLNVGLMYKGAGEGGTTAGGQAGSVGAGKPGMGMDMMSMSLMKAQKENIEADTQVKKKEAGVKEEEVGVKAETETNIKQSTDNLKAELKRIGVDTQIAEQLRNIKQNESQLSDMTFNQQLLKAEIEVANTVQQIRNSKLDADLKEGTIKSLIDTARLEVTGARLNNALRKENIEMSQAQRGKIAKELVAIGENIEQNWTRLNQQERELKVKEIMAEFETSTPQQIKQWTSLITDLIPGIGKLGQTKIGFK